MCDKEDPGDQKHVYDSAPCQQLLLKADEFLLQTQFHKSIPQIHLNYRRNWLNIFVPYLYIYIFQTETVNS